MALCSSLSLFEKNRYVCTLTWLPLRHGASKTLAPHLQTSACFFCEMTRSSSQLTTLADRYHHPVRAITGAPDIWTTQRNDLVASRVLHLLRWDEVKPQQAAVPCFLCRSCQAIQSPYLFRDTNCNVSELKSRAPSCDLCRMLLEALQRQGWASLEFADLEQDGAVVRLKKGPELLSVYGAPGTSRC